MRLIFLSYLLLLNVLNVTAQVQGNADGTDCWPGITTEAKPWTRWWWMGSAVNETDLEHLLKEYADRGFGGVEITPIYGVRGQEDNYISFLSPEWMKMLAFTIEAAGRNHLGVDMNTGTGWPFGGPQVTSGDAAMGLHFNIFENIPSDSVHSLVRQMERSREGDLLALSGINDAGKRINLLEQREMLEQQEGPGQSVEGTWTVYAATQSNTNQQVKRAAPGGEGLVFNHFSREATLQYLARFQSAMQGRNPGIRAFFNDSYELSGASSTSDLIEQFQIRKGYDLSLYLRELTGRGEEETIGRIKFDYRDVLGQMILENFTATWSQWAHGLGAVTRNQAHGSPANLIDLYREVDIPEVEIFNARHFPFLETYLENSGILFTESHPLFEKMAVSAAHLKGETLVSCETFTWLNEHFRTPLYQCKPELDRLFATGINHVFFHGTAYSPGEAPWPGWLFYASVHMEPNNPQWDDVESMNRYIARCQSVLQQGTHTSDLLVYWSPDEYNHRTDGLEQGLALDNSNCWMRLPGVLQLYKKGYQFDFISDRILGEAEVRDGQICTREGVMYRALVVPALERIRLETFQKILQLARGGASIFFGGMPERVTGFYDYRRREQVLDSLTASIPFGDGPGYRQARYAKGTICAGDPEVVLSSLDYPRETLSDVQISYISRKTGEGWYYFIANPNEQPVFQELTFMHGARGALLMDPLSGKVSLGESNFKDPSARVHVVLEPGASLIIYFTDSLPDGLAPYPVYTAEKTTGITGPWTLSFLEGVPELPPDTILAGLQFWTALPGDAYRNFAGSAAYTTQFYVENAEAGDCLLRLEHVEASARVIINGRRVATLWSFPFEVDVGPWLQAGENELRIEVSNLAANAIRYLDRQGVPWKNFHNINIVNQNYRPFDASGWDILPSGLSGSVELKYMTR